MFIKYFFLLFIFSVLFFQISLVNAQCISGIDGVCDMACFEVDFDCPREELTPSYILQEQYVQDNASDVFSLQFEEEEQLEVYTKEQRTSYVYSFLTLIFVLVVLGLIWFHRRHIKAHTKKEEQELVYSIRQYMAQGYSQEQIKQYLEQKYTSKRVKHLFSKL